jgi:hypothetical protein
MTHDFRASVRVLGYSPSQAAVAAGIALRTAYRILSGEQEPHLSMTLAIARHEHLVRVGCEQTGASTEARAAEGVVIMRPPMRRSRG